MLQSFADHHSEEHYLGPSGLGGLSEKLLLVALEMEMAGTLFNKDFGSTVHEIILLL